MSPSCPGSLLNEVGRLLDLRTCGSVGHFGSQCCATKYACMHQWAGRYAVHTDASDGCQRLACAAILINMPAESAAARGRRHAGSRQNSFHRAAGMQDLGHGWLDMCACIHAYGSATAAAARFESSGTGVVQARCPQRGRLPSRSGRIQLSLSCYRP
jgi:hypothetical protein